MARTRVGAVAAVTLALSLTCSLEPAGAEWTEGLRLTNTRDQNTSPVLATDREGDAALGWTRMDPHKSASDASRRVEAMLRVRVDGRWRKGRRLSMEGASAGVRDVALDDDGDGWVTYHQQSQMWLRRIFRGGRVGAPVNLGPGDFGGRIAIDAVGNALVAWQSSGVGGSLETVTAAYVRRRGTVISVETLAVGGHYMDPAPALSRDGRVGLVATGGGQSVLMARMTTPGTFEETETLHTVGNAEHVWQVEAFADEAGTATVLWGTGGTFRDAWLYAARVPAGETPTSPVRWTGGNLHSLFRSDVDRLGNVRVLWREATTSDTGWTTFTARTAQVTPEGGLGEVDRVAREVSEISMALRRNGSGLLGFAPPHGHPTFRPVTRNGDLGERRRSPVEFYDSGQTRRRFLVAYERSARGLGSAVWVRRGP